MGIKHIAFIGLGTTAVAGGATGIYFASQDKTIKDALTRKNINLINSNSDTKIWQIAWWEIKDIPTLKSVESTVTDHITLKTYCTEAYNKSLNDKTNIEKVGKICVQPSSTIRQTLIRRGEKLTTNWGTKLTGVKSQGGLLEKLKTINNQISAVAENQDNQNALKGWCEKRLDTELTVAGTEYTELKTLCI